MRIGIFFGGQSREREISFAGGRTVYDNLNKALFTPVPIFIDSLGNFILLEWKYLYKGTIRDFYPAAEHTPDSPHFFQVYAESLAENKELIESSIQSIGRKIAPEEFSSLMDFAFLALHGPFGEDGNIQGILEWYGVPYSGAGILPSSIGIDKEIQKAVLQASGFETPDYQVIKRASWQNSPEQILNQLEDSFNYPLVVKSPHQGSSIGVNIAKDRSSLLSGINQSFFISSIDINTWKSKTEDQKRAFLVSFTDIREGLGFPVFANGKTIYHPEDLWRELDESTDSTMRLESPNGESAVLVESFIVGREFSCIVIEDENGQPLALPPTEIRKSSQLFDYRSKYLPGISRKITPIDLPIDDINRIIQKAEELFTALHSQVYARLDGFITEDGSIFLNDPNTTSGMLPSSFFFHQAAEIGLNPSEFLTYIIAKSLSARTTSGKNIYRLKKLGDDLNKALTEVQTKLSQKTKVAVVMGGFSSERHISVESGRNIYEKLASSSKYLPIPIFLTGDENEHQLYQLPINIMLKDNADDIKEKILHHRDEQHPIINEIKEKAKGIHTQFTVGDQSVLQRLNYQQLGELVDFAFIALHGRPGEDGAIQVELEKQGTPYNGSGIESSKTSINKFETNKILRENGILVADHLLVFQDAYEENPGKIIDGIVEQFEFPLIAKPADDGCSSAVKKIKNREELEAFCQMMFRSSAEFPDGPMGVLNLKPNEEFPQKNYFLIETLISPNGADKFLEITGGMLTQYDSEQLTYLVFEPSEALASGEVLSLEEKFLAGEGQNITPARFANSQKEYNRIADSVKETLEKTARIIGVEGYCRIDAFVRIYPDKVETVIIEINSLPGMTPATAIFHQAALSEMRPYDFIDKIIAFGFLRKKIGQSS
ncbi:MAG: D-alanine--D-alanine ligase [Cyclobacteriaceae bacterium]